MSGIAVGRLAEERRRWRRDHPSGFYAKPMKMEDNSSNTLFWEAGIPGKEGTDWEGGLYKITMEFPEVRTVHLSDVHTCMIFPYP